jgi:hypothetical protein
MALSPVFIIGVPRSGTTLLRVLLDSHPQIAALPESPWLLGAYGGDSSLRSLLTDLTDGPFGVVRNVSGITPSHVLAAGRRLLDELFEPFMRERNKQMLVFKTPDDIPHLDFLLKLAPDAHYLHITRDGRDVCMSQLAKKGSFFEDLKSFGRLSYANAFRRWVEWEQRVRSLLHQPGVRVCHVKYEDLIADPKAALERITAFLGVPFEAAMLDYAAAEHDYPSWEAGSTDVAQREGISTSSLGQWRSATMTTEMRYTLAKYDDFVVSLGYPSSGIAPGLVDRVKMAAFPVTEPLADGAWRTWRGVRSDARRKLRTALRAVAIAAVAALAIDLLAAPVRPYQIGACLLAAVFFAVGFAPALARPGHGDRPYDRALARAAVVLGSALGLLTLVQAALHPVPSPAGDVATDRWTVGLLYVVYDVGAVILGVGVAWLIGRKAKGRLGRILRGEVYAS